MRNIYGKIIASLLSLALVFSVPVASRVISTNVSADEYSLVWSDEFDGNSLNTSYWNIEQNGNGGGNNELQYYLKNNIEVSGGTLKIHGKHESYGNKKYTSGRITTQNKKYFKYGKFEAKMKLPNFQGSWPAFWTLGQNIKTVGWPACGEMDIMENINTSSRVFANLHWSYQGNQADTQDGRQYDVGDKTQWHTYAMEWSEKEASFYVDGNLYQTYGISKNSEMEEFQKDQFIILNLAIGGNLPKIWEEENIDNTAFPDRSTMEVDYVRVYQKPEVITTEYDGPTIEVTEDAVEKYTGKWNEYFGGSGWIQASGSLTNNGKTADGYTLNVTDSGYVKDNDSAWCVQGNLERLPFYSNSTYTYKCTVSADKDKKVFVKVAGTDEAQLAGEVVNLKAGVPKNLEYKVVIPKGYDGPVSLKFGWGSMSDDPIGEHGSFTASVTNVSFVTTTTIPDPTYVPPTTTTKATTAAPTTTTKATTAAPTTINPTSVEPTDVKPTGDETTEVESTTEKQTETTTVEPTKVKPTTTKQVTPTNKTTPTKKQSVTKLKKAKIKKVVRKKKSLKVKVKKVKGATGYHIIYSNDKKFDSFDEKYVKKKTIKLKKLDRKTKYYIRVRAYRRVGYVYYFGKFSKRKKVKTK